MSSPSVLWAVLLVGFCLATSGYGSTMAHRSPQPRAADLCPEAPTTCPHCVKSPEQLLQQDVCDSDSTFYVLFKEDSVSHRHSPPSHLTLDSHVTLLQLDEPNSDKLYELKERCSKSHRVRRSAGYGQDYGGGT
ncbi:hypothetical protein IscW_ISCW003389 [Ixodes scapularis]|uniref:Uncharacterized protein n=1 Tax=Ixodes scapularis TaxID=6945 RepID=B7PDR3_IXOSC|nr:hypothetical protein IscW_ISCW003389 [Ixodes scapularis]|eukprot:XP_002411012.1 hypothetical protein IscW_ISCW003389 [Ixodes scapularis]